ncbi:MAG: radical SAM protein [Candidatus Peregrinibacteria bacterium GW2011_GWC2_39_14]|nr:MAG: Radical SAM domain protein [Candidatus Peregrinibacteria bacterium GW2011_GWA2_38_36]KKR06709.1 MAG: radical SAM protein [Candidatus Peregrinibacteria bacterium GW2011_GWC2_39_14]
MSDSNRSAPLIEASTCPDDQGATLLQKPPVLDGWGIFDSDKLALIKDKRLLKHIYAGVSGACDLHCVYCQTKSGTPMPGEMTLGERRDLLDQFKALGGEMVHIAGRGEPLVDPIFWDQLAYMKSLELKPVIFTHAAGMTDEAVDKLKAANASVIVKIHSLDEGLQDWFAGKKGYARARAEGMERLIAAGFNKNAPTKLGADILVMKKNLHEIESLFRWCREHNIFPLVKPFLTNERAATPFVKENLQITPGELRALYEKLSEIDRQEYGFHWKPAPPYAGIHCNYYLYHIMVTIMGDVAPCIGLPHIGNIREQSLADLWLSPEVEKVRNILDNVSGKCRTCVEHKEEGCYGCPCRVVYKKGNGALFNSGACFEDIV